MKMRSLEPEMKYRPLNYWGWLENIAPDEVRWQVRQMHEAGLGGYVMHARGGLQIPYMGSQWLESVKAMVQEGQALGMTTIVDDEDGWPSGFGAGKVTDRGEAFWLKWLVCEKVRASALQPDSRTIGIYRLEGNQVQALQTLETAGEEEELLHIHYDCSPYYVDNLDPQVVQAFIQDSYEAYYKEFKKDFGPGIWGIFSDEPQLTREHVIWSLTLPGEFQQRWGYDLTAVLPAVFFEVEGYEKVRYHFWRTVSELFTQSYARQLGEWCAQHDVCLLGHTLLEESLALQTMCSGSTMPFYEYMQVPGIDWLCRIAVNNMLVKQVSSVAQQLGKERVLSEMYGCAGWNVSFEELKWIGEWHYVLGVNLMLQHLGLYSLKGSRKREYPASLFYQQPWWGDFKVFNDYFARLSKLMTESRPVIELLVLHPIRSGWIAFNGFNHDRVNHYDAEFQKLTEWLLKCGFDFHYGDEEILLRHGNVKDKTLQIGQCAYKAVVLPPALSLDTGTVKLLQAFADEGGLLISAGEYPHLVEGQPNESLERLGQRVIRIGNTRQELENTLKGRLQRKVTITPCDGSQNEDIFSCTRKIDEDHVYYIVNTSREKGYDINIGIEAGGRVARVDLLEGTKTYMTGLTQVHLEPTQSIILTAGADTDRSFQAESAREREVPAYTEEKRISLEGEWVIADGDSNAITLDRCQYAIDQGQWQEETPVILLQEKLLSLGKPVDVNMKFRFRLEFDLKDKLYLVLEEPEKFILSINGRQVDCQDEGWWIDKSFRKIAIEDFVIKGDNEILLARNFYCSEKVYRIKNDSSIHEAESNRVTVETELESIYLLGNFSVDIQGEVREADRRALFVQPPFTLSAPRQQVDIRNLATRGYPFFAGRLKLSRKFTLDGFSKERDRLELVLSRPDAILVKACINGHDATAFLWEPYSADISQWVAEGENELVLELVNSCRNLLGPHHHTEGEMFGVGPYSYKDRNHWMDDYSLVRFGIENVSVVKHSAGL